MDCAIGQPFPDGAAIRCAVLACRCHRRYDEESWEEVDCDTMPGSQANEELERAFEEGCRLLKRNGKTYGYMASPTVLVEYRDCGGTAYEEHLTECR